MCNTRTSKTVILNFFLQAAGLTSQATPHTYASVTSQGVEASGHTPLGPHDSYMSSPTESHDHQQRQLYTVDDDDDDKPPSAHTVHS